MNNWSLVLIYKTRNLTCYILFSGKVVQQETFDLLHLKNDWYPKVNLVFYELQFAWKHVLSTCNNLLLCAPDCGNSMLLSHFFIKVQY